MRLKNSFSKFLRIRKKWEFSQIREKGAYFSGSVCRFRYVKPSLPSSTFMPKLGITVSKKYGNAVRRNEFKRWAREAFRQRAHDLPKGLKMNVSLASWAKDVNYTKVSNDFNTFVLQMNKRNVEKSPCEQKPHGLS